ncbi:MAG: hypothetical protein WAQ28_12610 [Bacteroidia bacterium]|jgi:hypothetical protein
MPFADNNIKHQKTLGFTAILVLTAFFIFIHSTHATTDTIKSKSQFDINDPRNPDCPCHKYQKLADEEYASKLGSSKNNEFGSLGNASHKSIENSFKELSYIPDINTGRDVGQQMQQKDNPATSDKSNNLSIAIVSKSLSHSYSRSQSGKRPKKSNLKAKLVFRYYLICKRLNPVRFKAENHLCFKWN